MSEEFKYIPYSPYDENLRGLIKNCAVYNLKDSYPTGIAGNISEYREGLSGILLPGNEDGLDELMRDVEYMKDMYPDTIKKVSLAVEDECDKLEYEGSPMLVEYPDREERRRIARKVYDDLSDRGEIKDDYKAELAELVKLADSETDMGDYETATSESGMNAYGEPPYVPAGPGCANCVMRNIIEMLVCNEFCVRRDRHRRRRRRFY